MIRRALAAALLLAGCQVSPATPTSGATFLLALEPEPQGPVTVTDTPRPACSPPTFPDHGSGNDHGGSGGGAAPPPAAPAIVTLESRYSARRLAGEAVGGGDLGADAASARFMAVAGLALASDGTLYVADPVRHEVRAVPSSGPTRVVAGLGDGTAGFGGDNVGATAGPLHTPTGLCLDPRTGAVIVADAGNGRIRVFTPGGRIYTLAGGGGSTAVTVANPLGARLEQPHGLAADRAGALYFTERSSGRVRRFTVGGALTTIATLAANAAGPLAVSADGASVWVGEGSAIRLVRAGGLEAEPVLALPGKTVTALAYDQAGTLFAVVTDAGRLGLAGTQVLRLSVGADGRMPEGRAAEAIAGTGGESAAHGDYALSDAPVADAGSVLLTGAWQTQLAIDLSRAADPALPGGDLILGNSYDDPLSGVRWGQVVKLEPR